MEISKICHIYELGNKKIPPYLSALQAVSALELKRLYPNKPIYFYGDDSMIDHVKEVNMDSLYDFMLPLPKSNDINTDIFWAWPKMSILEPDMLIVDTDAVLQAHIDPSKINVAHEEDTDMFPAFHQKPNGHYEWPPYYLHSENKMLNTSLLYIPKNYSILYDYLNDARRYAIGISRDFQNGEEIINKGGWEMMCLIEQKFLYDICHSSNIDYEQATEIEPQVGYSFSYSHLGPKKKELGSLGQKAEYDFFDNIIISTLRKEKFNNIPLILDIYKKSLLSYNQPVAEFA